MPLNPYLMCNNLQSKSSILDILVKIVLAENQNYNFWLTAPIFVISCHFFGVKNLEPVTRTFRKCCTLSLLFSFLFVLVLTRILYLYATYCVFFIQLYCFVIKCRNFKSSLSNYHHSFIGPLFSCLQIM